jgi:putative hydrolase of HD superfamily
MNKQEMENAILFFKQAFSLKHLDRAGWLRRKINPVESVASHSYGVSLIALYFLGKIEEKVDAEKILKLCIVHDVAESLVGDMIHDSLHDNTHTKEEKVKLEESAINELSELYGDDLKLLWKEYEKRSSFEAQLVKQFDSIDTALQAYFYALEHTIDGAEWIVTGEKHIKHPLLIEFYNLIKKKYASEIKSFD